MSMLPQGCLSEDGYIINQGMLREIPFGNYPSSKNGCGWIAVYNLMKALGNEKPYEEIMEALTPYTLFKGLLGTRMPGIKKYIRSQGYAMDTSFFKSSFEPLALGSQAGIIYYGTGKTYHFTAYQPTEEKTFRFFNSVYGRQNDILTMEQFIKRIKPPLTHIVAVRA